MAKVCAACGTPLADAAGIAVDEGRMTIARNGAAVHLGPVAFELFQMLHAKCGQVVRRDAIHARLYQLVHDDREPETIRCHIHHLRKAIVPLGIAIENIYGVGYALIAS